MWTGSSEPRNSQKCQVGITCHLLFQSQKAEQGDCQSTGVDKTSNIEKFRGWLRDPALISEMKGQSKRILNIKFSTPHVPTHMQKHKDTPHTERDRKTKQKLCYTHTMGHLLKRMDGTTKNATSKIHFKNHHSGWKEARHVVM